uniref:Uncharacterized protein n=1 Tax=Anguilla anguilla TaxID=7936 RepID=A0A0E9WXR2_ANGAN
MIDFGQSAPLLDVCEKTRTSNKQHEKNDNKTHINVSEEHITAKINWKVRKKCIFWTEKV